MTGKHSDNKGFKVEDKRRFDNDGEAREGVEDKTPPKATAETESKGQTEGKGETPRGEPQIPPINFATFILSLTASAQIHLGLIPDPSTNENKVSLPIAKHTIDTLEMLQEKTKGNLEEHEIKLFDQVLFELRMQYIEKQKQ